MHLDPSRDSMMAAPHGETVQSVAMQRRTRDGREFDVSTTLSALHDTRTAGRPRWRALALDPRHRGAHEYIGEAYLMTGDVANAEKHLTALRSICTLPCEEMRDLQAAIDAHRRGTAAR